MYYRVEWKDNDGTVVATFTTMEKALKYIKSVSGGTKRVYKITYKMLNNGPVVERKKLLAKF